MNLDKVNWDEYPQFPKKYSYKNVLKFTKEVVGHEKFKHISLEHLYFLCLVGKYIFSQGSGITYSCFVDILEESEHEKNTTKT